MCEEKTASAVLITRRRDTAAAFTSARVANERRRRKGLRNRKAAIGAKPQRSEILISSKWHILRVFRKRKVFLGPQINFSFKPSNNKKERGTFGVIVTKLGGVFLPAAAGLHLAIFNLKLSKFKRV